MTGLNISASASSEIRYVPSSFIVGQNRYRKFSGVSGCEASLGEEQGCYIEGCPRDWGQLPIPDGPLTVGIDGGYVKAREKPGGFEVIAGKSILAFRRDDDHPEASSKCFAFVQTYDDKPKRRLFELLRSGYTQDLYKNYR